MDFRIQTVHSWTFGGLIAAFLHLSLAYFLLCVSVYVFFTSKFLSLFGLYLPCPCNGVFGYKNSNLCWHTLLFHWPTAIICSVLNSTLSKLPFDFKNQGCSLDRKLVIKGSCENGVLELEGEASCSSSFHSPLLQNCVAKGKRVLDLKKMHGTRRRRKAGLGNRKFSSILPNDDSRSVIAANFPYDGSEMRGKDSESLGCEPVREDDFPGEIIGPISMEVGERNQHSFELSGSCDEGTSSSVATYITNAPDNMEIVRNEAYNIRMLELALEEEKAAHAALILELEKERAAAASAADEAMSMISRLHQDKASVEMELRQYQRMIEEKCDYDEEEMNILKEILVRREIENYFLEKKIEEYRHMSLLENEMPTGDINDEMDNWGQRPSSSLDFTDNKQPMLQTENNMLIGKKVGNRANWSSNYEAPLVEKQSQIQGYSLLEKNVFFAGKENENMDNSIECQEMTSEVTQICNGIDTNFSFDGEELRKYQNDKDQAGSNHHCSMPNTEPVVYDVHVVDDKNETLKDQSGSSIRNVVDEPKDCAVPLGPSGDWTRETLSDHPIISRTVTEPNIHKGSFDMSDKFSVLSHSQCKSLLSDEKSKLDIGIERLTERLRVLQEEKEELTFYLENGDGEKDN
ncbi:probable myosin-binding protein 6 [Quercus lobata]|uniref:GTD-binding domain-containing protein n=1 Tax=Quercus lobata TaxID=97700 RepID=A0A7N2RBF5_QUELO|nr:probable myosin-binding protein 6 [Quercus lobata]XP_030935281.1 probable myosin-binding protein 6 [Quercus lobata]